jgi:hypothetical protein
MFWRYLGNPEPPTQVEQTTPTLISATLLQLQVTIEVPANTHPTNRLIKRGKQRSGDHETL